MLMFFRSDRPTIATFLPTSTATSIACCMRWTLEANEEMTTRAVLVELGRGQLQRQLRRPLLAHADGADQERQRAHVVLVPVREDDGANLVPVVLQVREVGKDEIDPEVLVAREGEAGVDDDDV